MTRKILVISMMAAAALFLMQTMIFAGGTNPEPGTGCAADGRLKYIPPPFTGTVTLTYSTSSSTINVTGELTQVGNPDCTVIINYLYIGVDQIGWNNLKPVELRQQCLETGVDFNFSSVGCGNEYSNVEYFEAVGVGNLISNEFNPNVKTARVVGMPLQ
jgi:hypothetical protein